MNALYMLTESSTSEFIIVRKVSSSQYLRKCVDISLAIDQKSNLSLAAIFGGMVEGGQTRLSGSLSTGQLGSQAGRDQTLAELRRR